MKKCRKIAAFLTAMALTAGCGTLSAGAAVEKPDLFGDVDCNGTVNLVDVVLLNKNLMVGTELTDLGIANADVDLDGTLSAVDSLNILKSCIDLVTLPVGDFDFALGDVDADGSINASDAAMILKEIVDVKGGYDSTFDAFQKKAADVDGDGMLTAEDALYIMKQAAMVGAGADVLPFDELMANTEVKEGVPVTLSVDTTMVEYYDWNAQGCPAVPIYIRLENRIPAGFEAMEFGIRVDERCNYEVINNSMDAYMQGGEKLSYSPSYARSMYDYNTTWFSVFDTAWDEKDEPANVVLLMVYLPYDAKLGDWFDIEVLTKDAFWSTVALDETGNTTYRSIVSSQDGFINVEMRNLDYLG